MLDLAGAQCRFGNLNDVTEERSDSVRDKMQGGGSVCCGLCKGIAISAPRVR